jgi:hypothetical protein
VILQIDLTFAQKKIESKHYNNMNKCLIFSLVCLMCSCKPTGTLYFTVRTVIPSEYTSIYVLKSKTQRVTLVDSNNVYQLGDTFKFSKLKRISYE